MLATLETGCRYRGLIKLSRFERVLASPKVLKARLSAAGVRVLILRPVPEGYEVAGVYLGPSGVVNLPPQVTYLERYPLENLDNLEPPKVRGSNPRSRKSVRVRRPSRKVLG